MSVDQRAAHLPVPVRARSLAPSAARNLALATWAHRAIAQLAPLVRASVAVAAAGFAVEYGLRALVTRGLAPARRQSAALGAPGQASRIVVTELVIRERVRRVR